MTSNAAISKRSGRNAKGPKPKVPNPANPITNGLHVMSFMRKNEAKSVKPIVNSDFVFK